MSKTEKLKATPSSAPSIDSHGKPAEPVIDGELKRHMLVEYADVGENWRFFIGLRFTALRFFATINGALLAILGWTFTKDSALNYERIMRVVAIAGIVVVVSTVFVEYRLWRLFQVALKRGMEIEDALSLSGGQYHCFKASEKSKSSRLRVITHTRAIILFYTLAFALWLLLMIFPHALAPITTAS